MNSRKTPLRVASSANIGYAPQYVASALGLFEAAGLDVTLLPQVPPGSGRIVETLKDGTADLVLGSVLFAMRLRSEGFDPVLVCQSNQNISHGILARADEAKSPFCWDDLRGSALLIYPSHIPTPWIAFREALWQKNIPLDAVSLMVGFTPAEAIEEFRRGAGSFLVGDLETISGQGLCEVARVSDALGPIPWSVYCTTQMAAQRQAEPIAKFRGAIAAAVDWLYCAENSDAVAAVAPFFPQVDAGKISGMLQRFVAARLWAEGGGVSREQARRWQGALLRGGFIGADVSLEAIIVDA